MDSRELLVRIAQGDSDEAFAELVSRYVNLVHSVAMRRAGQDSHLAEDIVQKVFADLAQKGRSLPPDTQLGGWLHRHTCFVASTFVRAEHRRQARERIAMEMNNLHESPDTAWQELAPLLDEAVNELDPPDREAIVLRFFEQCDLRSVGRFLGTTEDAAQKRVSRALDRLKAALAHKGVTLSAAVLASIMASHAIQPAPASLARDITQTTRLAAPKAAGILGGVFAQLSPGSLRLAMLGAGTLLLGILWWSQPTSTGTKALTTATTTRATDTSNVGATRLVVESSTVGTPGPVESAAPPGGTLRLTVLAADSGEPVPNVEVDCWRWENSNLVRGNLVANRAGLCNVPAPQRVTTWLQLTTRLDGYADTRLEWRPDRGEIIPASYTLRLARPVPISGRVVDADGQPVADATIGFGYRENPMTETRPESHRFGWIGVTTDVEGRWSLRRIAPDMLRQISASARHPEHVNSESIELAVQPETEKQLRAGTHVFHLGRPAIARGVVVDAANNPIPNAKVLVGMRGETGSREGMTANDGSFVINGCRPGKSLLTAEAESFAAASIPITLGTNTPPFRLTLALGRTLALRVVDQGGQPIAGANVWLRTRDDPDESGATFQADMDDKTGRDGRLIWSNAPDRPLTFDFHASRFMRLDNVRIQPDGTEHRIILQPALTISGTVRDADGQPLPRFRMVTGWPDEMGRPQWSSLDRFWVSFRGGRFEHRFEEPVVSSQPNPAYVLKFEAAGYMSSITRTIRADEGEAVLDVVLQRATTDPVVVRLPDGRPAARTDIGLVFGSAGLSLGPVGFLPGGYRNPGSLLQTDDEGHFRPPPDPTITRIIAASGDGYAEATPAALQVDPTMQLQPWGRIEGSFQTNGLPVSGQELLLEFIGQPSSALRSEFKAQTDAQGHFTFEHAPPGRHLVTHLIPEPVQEPRSWGHRSLTDVEVQSDETTRVTLGGNAFAFRLQLQWPEGMSRQPDWNLYVSLQTLLRPVPGFAPDTPEAFVVAAKSAGTCRVHLLTPGSNNSWAAESIPEGHYLVHARVTSRGPDGRPIVHATGETWTDVPAQPTASPIDLGGLSLHATGPAGF